MKLRTLPRIILPFLILTALPSEARAANPRDGAWWLAVTTERREGYVAGVVDCSSTEGKNRSIGTERLSSLQKRATKHYADHPDQAGKLAVRVILEVGPKKALPVPKGGEVYSGEHGFFDGNFWRMMSEDQQLGFVEGYIDCLSMVQPKGAPFSKDPAWYQEWISEWLGTTQRDQGVIRLDRETAAIANALKLARNAGSAAGSEPRRSPEESRK